MRHSKIGLAMAALLLVGAGCGAGDVAVPARQANNDTALSTAPNQINLNGMQLADISEDGSAAAPDAMPVDGEVMQNDSMSNDVPTQFPGILPDEELQNKQVRITTSKGEIVFDVLANEAPKAASNLIALAKSGYYDGIVFHRVEPGFVIQGGDPTGTGRGGPGYQFEDETVSLDYDAGIVAMANAGPNTNGSQFFIVLQDQPSLPKLYTIFGRVTSGMEVVRSIEVGDVMTTVVVEDK